MKSGANAKTSTPSSPAPTPEAGIAPSILKTAGAAGAATPKPTPSAPYPRGEARVQEQADDTVGVQIKDQLDDAADQAFDRLMGTDEAGGDTTGDEVAEDGDGEPDGEVEETTTDEMWESAKAELKKSKWTEKAIAALSKKEALDIADHARKMSRDFSKLAGENGGLKSALEKHKRSQEAKAQDANQAAATPAQDFDEKALAPLLSELGEQAAKPLLDHLRSHSASLKAKDAQIEVLTNFVRDSMTEKARGALVDQFPKLADSEAFGRVQDRMGKLAATEDYADATALMRDAAMLEFADDLLASRKEAESNTKRRNGSLTPPKTQTRTTVTRAQAEDTALNETYDALMKGKPEAELRAIYRAHAQ